MKTKILTLLFTCSILFANAQVDLGKVAAAAPGANVGSLIGQLGKGIVPSSFSDGWSKVKDKWFKDVEGITDVKGAKKAISTLFKNLKPSALTSAFASTKDEWSKKLKGAKSLSDIGSSLGSLASGLNPSSLTPEFAGQQSMWSSALSALK